MKKGLCLGAECDLEDDGKMLEICVVGLEKENDQQEGRLNG